MKGLNAGSVSTSTERPKNTAKLVLSANQLKEPDRSPEVRDQVDIGVRTLLSTGRGPEDSQPDDSITPAELGESILVELDHARILSKEPRSVKYFCLKCFDA